MHVWGWNITDREIFRCVHMTACAAGVRKCLLFIYLFFFGNIHVTCVPGRRFATRQRWAPRAGWKHQTAAAEPCGLLVPMPRGLVRGKNKQPRAFVGTTKGKHFALIQKKVHMASGEWIFDFIITWDLMMYIMVAVLTWCSTLFTLTQMMKIQTRGLTVFEHLRASEGQNATQRPFQFEDSFNCSLLLFFNFFFIHLAFQIPLFHKSLSRYTLPPKTSHFVVNIFFFSFFFYCWNKLSYCFKHIPFFFSFYHHPKQQNRLIAASWQEQEPWQACGPKHRKLDPSIFFSLWDAQRRTALK